MKNILIFFLLFTTLKVQSQTWPTYSRQLQCLDSIARCDNISCHFGKVYYDLLLLINEQFTTTDTATQRLVQYFEADFAASYINACIVYQDKTGEQSPAWGNYFADTSLTPVQYKLLGANAHLNGGFLETVTRYYQKEQWEVLDKNHALFATCLNKTYKQLYKEAFRNSNKIKALAFFTLGIDKLAGLYYLHKWTNRQRRLIDYHFTGNAKYKKLLARVNRRKESFDRLIVKLL